MKNLIIARRLAFIPRDSKRTAEAYLAGKTKVSDIAEKYDISETQALYGIRQQCVEHGLVETLEINADDKVQVTDVHGEGEYADWAWLACRAGVTPQRLQKTAKS